MGIFNTTPLAAVLASGVELSDPEASLKIGIGRNGRSQIFFRHVGEQRAIDLVRFDFFCRRQHGAEKRGLERVEDLGGLAIIEGGNELEEFGFGRHGLTFRHLGRSSVPIFKPDRRVTLKVLQLARLADPQRR